MEKEYILVKHFRKLISSQPFFIWNTLKNEDEDFVDEAEMAKNFWNNVIEQPEEANYGTIAAKTTALIDAALRDKLLSEQDCTIISGSLEEQIENTKKALLEDKLIISPVFEYNGAVAKPFAFDPKTKVMIELKYAKKTKNKDLIQPYWDYQIASKSTKIKDIFMFLPNNRDFVKGKIDLVKVDSINYTGTGKNPGQTNKKGETSEVEIIKFVKSPSIPRRGKHDFVFPTLDNSIEDINKAKDAQISKAKLSMDVEQLFKNTQFNELLEKLNFKYAGWNGKVIKAKDIVDYFSVEDDSIFSSELFNTYNNINSNSINKDHMNEIKRIDEAKRVIWYDFEGYSLPFPPLDGIGPHNQLVFQVSVIETTNNVETNLENIVLDPKTISLDGIYQIIESVYAYGADEYVVYNKGYENTRMNEYVTLMEETGYPKASQAREMLDHIDLHTVDLMKLFVVNSAKTIPPVLLHDQKTRYSIKNVEKHISNNNIQMPRPIRQYANLDIQNGGMAMETAIHRAIGIIGDKEWEQKVKQLEDYCENDVRAMIVVYDFVKGLLNGTN